MPQLADLPRVETVEPVGGADVQQYVTYVRLQDQAIYKYEVLRQTEEANVIVASSYNAVAKWSLMNSLKFHNVLNIVYSIADVCQEIEQLQSKGSE